MPSARAKEKAYDYLIRNAVVYDGESSRPLKVDVALIGDSIVEVGKLQASDARHVIDAGGLVLAPGFIDAHTHSDFNPLIYPKLHNKLMQGVTTEIVGNCGMSAAPVLGSHDQQIGSIWAREGVAIPSKIPWASFREYHNGLEAAGLDTNFAALVGHGNLRSAVMGFAARPAAKGEIDEMERMLTQAMEEGARGISFGLVYLPGIFAKEEELVALCRVAGRHGGGVCAFHMRSEGSKLLESIREVIEISELADSPIQISHLKAAGKNNFGKIKEAFQIIEEARGRGIRVEADAYPYAASAAELGVILPDSLYEREDRVSIFQDTSRRDGLLKELREHFQKKGMNWDAVMIATVANPKDRHFEGRTVKEISQETGKEPEAVLIGLLTNSSFEVSAFNFSQSQEVVDQVVAKPYVAVGSDSIADGSRKPHPRTFGTFPKILKGTAREKRGLELGEAIRKMTSLPADHFGLAKRGRIQPGYFADLVLFDPNQITDHATYEKSNLPSVGVQWVFVNGQPAVKNGLPASKKSGRVL